MSYCVNDIALSPGQSARAAAVRPRTTLDFRQLPIFRNSERQEFASDRADLADRLKSLRFRRENALQYNQISTQALEFAAPGTARKREDDSYPLASFSYVAGLCPHRYRVRKTKQ